MYLKYVKRFFDLALTIPGFIIFSPLLALIAMLVGAWVGSLVLFRQTRFGLHGKPFTLYKFRTMTVLQIHDVFYRSSALAGRISCAHTGRCDLCKVYR